MKVIGQKEMEDGRGGIEEVLLVTYLPQVSSKAATKRSNSNKENKSGKTEINDNGW